MSDEVLARPVFVSLIILSQDSPSVNSFCTANIKVTLLKTLVREEGQGQLGTVEGRESTETKQLERQQKASACSHSFQHRASCSAAGTWRTGATATHW